MDAVIDALKHERGAAGFGPTVRRRTRPSTSGRTYGARQRPSDSIRLLVVSAHPRRRVDDDRTRPSGLARRGLCTRHATRTPPSRDPGDRRLGDLAATSIRGRTRVGPIRSARPIGTSKRFRGDRDEPSPARGSGERTSRRTKERPLGAAALGRTGEDLGSWVIGARVRLPSPSCGGTSEAVHVWCVADPRPSR